jgi:HK97 family phage major capsid protein
MSISKKGILEIQQLSSKAEALASGTPSQRKQADVLCQRISTIKQIGLSTDEVRGLYCEALIEDTSQGTRKFSDAEYRQRFDRYVAGRIEDSEMRDFLAGTQSITYTQGAAGGYTVPLVYDETLRFAMAQVDPVLDEKVTSFSMTPGPTLQAEQISGFDLSSITAQIIGESSVQNPQVIPSVLGATLRNNVIFKATFAASWEAEQDIPDFGTKIVRASGVALARRIGQSVLAGRGGADISGVVQALGGATVSNATAGKIVNTDITKIFFSVDRFYRAAPKCGFLMNDSVYKLVRNATDAQGRPLVSISDGGEVLMGRPVYVSPSMATLYSSIGLQGALLFGDLSSIVIRASRPQIERSIESAQADITRGEAAWIARARCDAAYFDPSSGTNPPLVLAAIN